MLYGTEHHKDKQIRSLAFSLHSPCPSISISLSPTTQHVHARTVQAQPTPSWLNVRKEIYNKLFRLRQRKLSVLSNVTSSQSENRRANVGTDQPTIKPVITLQLPGDT